MIIEPKRVQTSHLFPDLATNLIDLLRSLDRQLWFSKTCYPNWTVHDIATHLLFTAVNRLSEERDRFRLPRAGDFPLGYERLSEAIDKSNTRWAEALSTVSPEVVVELLGTVEFQLADYFSTLNQEGHSPIGVGWAGKEHPERWFETAREFTERWHHQQQIRDAVAASTIANPEYLRPVLETLLRAVPFWYSSIVPSRHVAVVLEITGPAGGTWTTMFREGKWELYDGKAETLPDAEVRMSEDTAWRFLTRTITAKHAESRIEFSGDEALSHKFLDVVSVMIPERLR